MRSLQSFFSAPNLTLRKATVTNDIFTREDQEFLIKNKALPESRILAIETGGCPHAAIREDISANMGALETLQAKFACQMLFVESGGDNLAANYSRELADYIIYVIDVSVRLGNYSGWVYALTLLALCRAETRFHAREDREFHSRICWLSTKCVVIVLFVVFSNAFTQDRPCPICRRVIGSHGARLQAHAWRRSNSLCKCEERPRRGRYH